MATTFIVNNISIFSLKLWKRRWHSSLSWYSSSFYVCWLHRIWKDTEAFIWHLPTIIIEQHRPSKTISIQIFSSGILLISLYFFTLPFVNFTVWNKKKDEESQLSIKFHHFKVCNMHGFIALAKRTHRQWTDLSLASVYNKINVNFIV